MMTVVRRLMSIVGWLLRRDRAEKRLDDEMRTFIEMSAAEKMRDGMAPAEARRLAILEIGGMEPLKERVRTERHGALLDEVARDVRYGFRTFGRNPGFTIAVLTTLALGIGANTAIFSLIDALMLRSLPVRQPHELVQVRRTGDQFGEVFSYDIVRALDARSEIFSGVAGFSGFTTLDVDANGSVERVSSALVAGGFFETLGLQPAAGRLLTRQDDEPGAIPAVVISYGYWERQLGKRADIIGQKLRIHGTPVDVVGVTPRGFVGATVGGIADITMAVAAWPQVDQSAAALAGPGNFWLRALARPRPGVPVAQATARLNAAWPGIAEATVSPRWPANRRKELAAAVLELVPGGTGYSYLRGVYRRPLFVLMAVAGVVLLIASANVASLLLARATTRRKEVAVRLAIGAGRGRIVRQMLIESTLLALVGAAFGVAMAWPSSRALVSMISSGPIALDLTPNWHVLAFAAGVAMLTGLLFGAAPALQAAAPAAASLSEGAKGHRPRSRLLRTLVIAQVAMSLVLLAGAGLFVRTLQNLQDFDSGFESDGVLLVDLEGRRNAVPRQLVEEIRRVPGVASVTLTTHTPLSGSMWSDPVVPLGQALPERDTALFVGAGPGFLPAMQIRLLAGRDFDERDTRDGPPVAIVNEEYARRYFAKESPIGQRLSASVRGERRDLAIVGVVRNTSTTGLRQTPPATVYVSYAQLTGDLPTTIVIRATGALARASAAIEQVVRARVPGSPIEVRPLSAQVQGSITQERLLATLAGAFGVLALTLASVGLYGLLAYGVGQRTKEIGIRVALGARVTTVVGLVLRDGALLVIVGLLLGLPAAWAASRLVESMLFGLTATDVPTIAGAMMVLFAAGQLAAWLPARRAARVNPLVALRHE